MSGWHFTILSNRTARNRFTMRLKVQIYSCGRCREQSTREYLIFRLRTMDHGFLISIDATKRHDGKGCWARRLRGSGEARRSKRPSYCFLHWDKHFALMWPNTATSQACVVTYNLQVLQPGHLQLTIEPLNWIEVL